MIRIHVSTEGRANRPLMHSNIQYSTNVPVQSAGMGIHVKVSNFMEWHEVETGLVAMH